MRCNSLITTGIKNAWAWLSQPKGCSGTVYWKATAITSVIAVILLTISFYYHNIRRVKVNGIKKRKFVFSCAGRYPYEPFILLLWATTYWFNNLGLTLIQAFSSPETRTKMWEGMDILGGDGRTTLFFIAYFIILEILEITVSEKFMMKRYRAYKEKKAAEALAKEEESLKEFIDEKRQVSIYEAIATTPVPTESESESLLTDPESNTPIEPRLSLLQRFRNRLQGKKDDVTAEAVLMRHYMLAFMKGNLLMCFAMLANSTVCQLSPEQYFDNKVDGFMLVGAGCFIWTIRGFWTLSSGLKFARTEMKKEKSVEL